MKKTVFKVIRIVIILVLIGVIAYEGYKIYDDQKDYQIADTEYEEIRTTAISWPSQEDDAEVVGYPLITVDFDGLEEINPDFTAWLYFPALELSYPVVKEQEIDQYIHKTFDGKYNKAGCLFEDILSDENFCGRHDMIFGHNMKNGSMFGALKKLYKKGNENVLKDNPYFYIYTRNQVFEYRAFSYYGTAVGSKAYSEVTTDEEYDEFADFIKRNSMYEAGKDYDLSERPSILTLSTCSGNTGSGRRFVVHGAKTNSWDVEY